MTSLTDDVVDQDDTTSRHTVHLLARRWPTWLALALVGLTLSDFRDGLELAVIPGIAAVGYLLMAVLDRPRITWPMLIVVTALVPLSGALEISVWWVLSVVAAALTVAGLALGPLRHRDLRTLQSVLAAVLLGLSITALAIAGDTGRLLVAMALVGHAAVDLILWRANRIVPRSFAEWCGVLDLSLGAVLFAVVLT